MLLLNRFTVEQAEESVSNVTAEKKTAQTDRETPFWRIKSVKWLWESGEGSWMCPPGWRALRKTPQFLLPRLNLLSFFSLYWCSSDPSLPLSHFSKSIFSLKCSAFSRFSTFSSLFLFFPLVKSLLALLLPLWLIASFFLKHSMADRQTDRHSASQSEMRQSWTWFRGHFQMPPWKGRSHFLSLLVEF